MTKNLFAFSFFRGQSGSALSQSKEILEICFQYASLMTFRTYALNHLYLALDVYLNIRRVPGNQVLGLVFLFFFVLCKLVWVSERRAIACLIMLSAKQGSHWYHFYRLWYGAAWY